MTDPIRPVSEEDAPLVPELPRNAAVGAEEIEVVRFVDPPVDTGYAEERTRDTEEIVPMVPDLTRRTTD